MTDLIRESTLGQLLRVIFGPQVLPYPEEQPDFVIPQFYLPRSTPVAENQTALTTIKTTISADEKETGRARAAGRTTTATTKEEGESGQLADEYLRRTTTAEDADDDTSSSSESLKPERRLSTIVSRTNLSHISSQRDLEQAYADAVTQAELSHIPSLPIAPQKTKDGTILVDWYTTTDDANPQNWSRGRKTLVVLLIYTYTFAIYMGSSIYTPSAPFIEEIYGVTPEVSSLGLSLYVVGYGIGPLLFSPLSEIPVIGRNVPYMVSFGLFVILCIPTSITNSLAGFFVLRFLLGFMGSPCLATGAASLGDIYSFMDLPYFLTGWAAFATAGPSLGPLISGFSVPALSWHWSSWEILFLTGPTFLALFLCLPETSTPTILLRRAQRLRKLTGNDMLRSQSEIDQHKLSVREIVVANLWRPLQINMLDPSVLFTSVYVGLMYGTYYSFFESFPFVYATGLPRKNSPTHGYGFNEGQAGLVFLSMSVGVVFAIAGYIWYLARIFDPDVRKNGMPPPEKRLVPALLTSVFVPAGLFWFAWTGFNSPKIHWIVPTMGISVIIIGIFTVFQCVFIYIALGYPQYAASLFAGNDFARSSMAAGAIHFARPLYLNLGIGPGTSLLAGLSCGGVVGIWILWLYGAKLRAWSRFAV